MTSRILDDEAAKHNGGVTPGVFFHHVKEWSNLESQAMAIKAKMAAAKKLAKDDGVDHADMVHSIKQSKRPLAEQLGEHNRRVSYMRFMKLPIGTHMNFIDENISDTTGLTDEEREENWKAQGLQAGLMAKNRDDCPHDPNSVAGRFWLQGYEEGQAQNAAGIKAPKPEKVAKEKKPAKGKAKDTPPAPTEVDTPLSSLETPVPNAPVLSDDDWDAAAPNKDGQVAGTQPPAPDSDFE